MGLRSGYIPSGYVKIATENGEFIVDLPDLPIENGGSFHSYVNVYQRVYFSGYHMGYHMGYIGIYH